MQTAATITVFVLLGMTAGALHFTLLRRNIDLIVAGGSTLAAIATTLGRLALTVAIFALTAIFYGIAVLWLLAGFMAARAAAVRILRVET
jgi:hypothetical protein